MQPVQPKTAAGRLRPSPLAANRPGTLQTRRLALHPVLQCLFEQELADLTRDVSFTRLPTQKETEELNRLIRSGNKVDRQRAIDLTLERFGIGFHDDPMTYDPRLGSNDEAETNPGVAPRIGKSAFHTADQASLTTCVWP